MYFLTVLYDHQSLLVHIPLSHLVSIVSQIAFVSLIANQNPVRKLSPCDLNENIFPWSQYYTGSLVV